MTRFTYKLELYFNGTPADVTSHLVAGTPMVLETGIRDPGPTQFVAESGTLRFTLRNGRGLSGALGVYSLWHTNKRSGFELNMLVKLSVNDGGGFFPVFFGRLIDVVAEPWEKGQHVTHCQAIDAMGTLSEMHVSGVTTQTNKRADELITTLMAAVGDPDYGVHYSAAFETGVSTFPFAFDSAQDNQTTVREELHRICASERGHCYITNTLIGTFLTFHNQNHESANATFVRIFDDAMDQLVAGTSRDDVVQRVQATVYPTIVDAAATTVIFSLGSVPDPIQSGEVNQSLFGPYRDPANPSERIGATEQVTPAATTDYTMNASADGLGADLTANFTVTANFTSNGVNFTITNNGVTAGFITKLQVRGKGVYRRPVVVQASGPTTFGTRTLAFVMPYQNYLSVAQSIVDDLANLYGDPATQRASSVRFLADSAATLIPLGDRISLTETQTGLANASFTVRGAKLDCQASGHIYVTWYLETESVAGWTTPAYAAGDFTGKDSMTWGVDASPDRATYAYMLNGKTMDVAFHILSSDVGGTPSTALQIAIPAGKVATKTMTNPYTYSDAGGAQAKGTAQVTVSGTVIQLFKTDPATNWTATTGDNTLVSGQIRFEVD